jgi:hypothetical protein
MTQYVAGLLSLLFPGLGQAFAGKRGRAAIVAFPVLAVLVALTLIVVVNPGSILGPAPDQEVLTSLLVLDAVLAVYHLWAVLDAYVLAGRARSDRLLAFGPPRQWTAALSVAILVAGTVGIHAGAAEFAIAWQHDLGCKAGATACWFDISYPQCGSQFPAGAEFGIVGVNKGIVFSANPCLGKGDGPAELSWAGGVSAQLYANTGNPGPSLSSKWPSNQASPRPCDTSAVPGPDTAACAYDYGWNATADSYKTAVAAYVSLNLASAGATSTPSPNKWWLDVEIENSWRTDTTLNVAALAGAVAYLRSVGAAGIGFYSTQYQWDRITGGTSDFAAYPSWVAGAESAARAVSLCGTKGFTGGRVELVQYLSGGFDADFPCQRDGK